MVRMGVCLGVAAMALAGCAKPPEPQVGLSAYSRNLDLMTTQSISVGPLPEPTGAVGQPMPKPLHEGLAGRTLTVARTPEVILHPGEVILTFDDGPRPGRTEAILDTLDSFGVKGTFMMVGYAAEARPDLVRMVAERGHTIGTHTHDHADLAELSRAAAFHQIHDGQQSVADALAPIHAEPSRFFRFPYLAQTQVLRTRVMDDDLIILDVDVDSKDYYQDTPDAVLARTLRRLDAKGQGIVLFHDIHARTVAMLPDFLEALDDRGYSVVTLRSHSDDPFQEELVTAQAPDPISD